MSHAPEEVTQFSLPLQDSPETPREAGGRSRAVMTWHARTAMLLSIDEIVSLWNDSLKDEAVELQATPQHGKGLVRNNFLRNRKSFWAANEAMLRDRVEFTPEGGLRLKSGQPAATVAGPVEAPARSLVDALATTNAVSLEVPAKKGKSTAKVIKEGQEGPAKRTLGATERAILMQQAPSEVLSDDLRKELQGVLAPACDEAARIYKTRQNFVFWAAQKADAELQLLAEKRGDDLWLNAVTVEVFPDDPNMKVIFVRSSTAPLFGHDGGPIVKHDYRANGLPVTIHHEQMFRQGDNQRLIRSKVIRAKNHEYYVKALRYVDGTFLRGYFTVDGDERSDLARYYQVSGNKVEQINENQYRVAENRKAAGMNTH